jgi:hypothetical protein
MAHSRFISSSLATARALAIIGSKLFWKQGDEVMNRAQSAASFGSTVFQGSGNFEISYGA